MAAILVTELPVYSIVGDHVRIEIVSGCDSYDLYFTRHHCLKGGEILRRLLEEDALKQQWRLIEKRRKG